ncbi:MAG TPA: GxxExxY protein [Pirellulales bacterium]|jgi:GxxExxY protein|nr:GxxExxY protein [Pirellulales bacterium]
MEYDPIPDADEELATRIIGAAIEVHRELGPGFIEFVYEQAMLYELSTAGISVEKQKKILVPYKGIQLAGQRLDLIVGGRIILELKSVEQFAPIHQAQILSYLKATGLRLGLLINFKAPTIKGNFKRVVR